MGVREAFPEARPPAPRFAVSFRHGARTRTIALPPPVFYTLFGAVTILAAWYLCATLYLIFRDDMLASLMKREVEMQYTYEGRIATLRTQLERETSRQLVDQNAIEVKLRDLAARQTQIDNRGAIIVALAQRAGAAVERTSGKSSVAAVAAQNPLLAGVLPRRPLPAEVSAFAPVAIQAERVVPAVSEKPRPVQFDLRQSTDPVSDTAPSPPTPAVPERLSSLDQSINTTAGAQLRALAALAGPAAAEAARIRSAFATAGLSPERFEPKRAAANRADADVGGPYVPLAGEPAHSLFAREAGTLQNALLEVERLRRTLDVVPLRQPLPGPLEVSSPFGPRLDPFLGRPALHTGIDLRGEYGAHVHATAAGKVTNAGRDGGYGNMVEIDHGNGLSTRYAHLSSIIVTDGQWVQAGQVIGMIGATGRATGPHLHYETRIDGEPVDPTRFLRASAKLNLGIQAGPLL